jgi:ubiquinone/menaquinone biosynthesis C-methylase UbiE
MRTADAWERFYRGRPRPWGGAVDPPPMAPGSSVLELGCGGGRLLLPLLNEGTAGGIVGADISRTSLLQLSGRAPGILVRADAASLPFRDRAFDIVLCRHVLGHLAEEARKVAATEVLRTLKRGGCAFFEGFSVSDFRFGKGRKVEEGTFIRGDGTMSHYFAEHEVRGLFSQASSVSVEMHQWSERAGRARMARESIRARIIR